MKTICQLICIAVIALTSACSSTSSRISKDETLFNTYTPAEKKMIRTGQVAVGFDQDQVRMALGDPDREATVENAGGKQIVWEYRNIKPSLGFSVGASTGSWSRSGVGTGVGVGVSPDRTKLLKRIVFDRLSGTVKSIQSFD